MPDRPRILITRLFAIGDVVMATSAIQLAREHIPNAHITCMVGRWSAPVLECNPHVDNVLIVDDAVFFERKRRELIRLALALRHRKFGTVISLHASRAVNLFLSASTAPARFFCFSYRHRRMSASRRVEIDLERHKVDLGTELVSLATGTIQGGRIPFPQIHLDPSEVVSGETIVHSRLGRDDGEIVCVCPGGGRNPGSFEPSKRWNVNRYRMLVKMIVEGTGHRVLILGSSEELPILERTASGTEERTAIVSGLDLRLAMGVINTASLVVGNDSGLLHIAAALGKPTITLFGPTSPSHVMPFGPRSRILHRVLSCSPCDVTKRDHRHPVVCTTMTCMESIYPSTVLSEIRKVLRDARVTERSPGA